MGDTCLLPGCDRERREQGEEEYPDSDITASNGEPFRVSAYGSKFCSSGHELKYEHLKADADDARRDEQQDRGTPKSDRPECDGPPF